MIGKTLTHYRVIERIDSGGMGIVYRAHDERLERDVAIKVLPAGTLADEAARRRFRNEALALSKLNHPNIASIYDFDSQDGVDFLVMELVEGETLDATVRAGALTEERTAALGAQLARGMAAAHERGVVHRDLKPGNLRVTKDGRLKILDFGLARLTRSPGGTEATQTVTAVGVAVGTFPYMAPEQLRGETTDARTDIYASGAVLYELATGRRPFADYHGIKLAEAILRQTPEPPSALHPGISPTLERIILKALDKSSDRRYQSATDLALDLERLSAPTHWDGSRAQRSMSRRRRWVLLGAAAGICLLAGFLIEFPRIREYLPGRRPVPTRPSLAVLYFQNFGPSRDDEYLAAGITEDVITSLSQLPGLRVVSRSAVDRYRGLKTDPRQVGRDLSVSYVLEGSIRRSGEDLRVTAQLINTNDGFHVWADRYESRMADIFAVQDTIASRIASALRTTVGPEEQAKISRRWTENAQAYACYLTGREVYFDLTRPQPEADARPWFEKAISLDPEYAPALAGLADVLAWEWFRGRRPHDATARALALATKAEKVDPLLATAWRAEGRAHWLMRGDIPRARRALDRSIAVNPRVAESYWTLAETYLELGKHEHAMVLARRAIQVDPDWAPGYVEVTGILRAYGSYEEAEKLVDAGLVRLPNEPLLLWARAQTSIAQRHYREAIDPIRQALKVRPNFWGVRADLVDCLHQLGRDTEADSILRSTIERWPDVPRVLNRAATYEIARGRLGSAESLSVRAIQIDPDFYFARRTLAECYLKSGRPKEAERAYLDLAKTWPDQAETRVDVARFYTVLKRYKEAEQWAKEAIGLNPRWEVARGQLAWEYHFQGRFDQAAQTFREAIQLRSDSYWNYRGLALTLQSAGKIKESLKPAQRSVDLKPDYVDGLVALGNAYTNDPHRAAEAYERALAIDSTRAGALNNLANIYLREERFLRALAMYRRAAELDSVRADYWINIALLAVIYLRDFSVAEKAAAMCISRGRGTLAEAAGFQCLGVVEDARGQPRAAQGHYRKGLALIEVVLRRTPNDRDAVSIAGRLSARVGDVANARKRADWLIRTQQENPAYLYDAADIMAVAGEKNRALEYLRSALAAGFDDRGLMARDPDLDTVRKDPRFKGILASVQ